VSVVCCQVVVSASGRSLVQRSPTDCYVSECDHGSSIMRWPWPTVAVASWYKHMVHKFHKSTFRSRELDAELILAWLVFGTHDVLLRVNEQRNILNEIRKRKANCFGHILRRNCLLKKVIEGKIKGEMEVARRRGRRRKKLLDYLKDTRGYFHLKEEALDRPRWKHRFGGGFGPFVRQNTE